MTQVRFEPKNAKEAEEFAIGELIADLQHSVLKILDEKGMNQAELAAVLGVSRAAVSQLLGSASNLSVQRLAKVYHALGYALKIENAPESCSVLWHAVPMSRMMRVEDKSGGAGQWRFDDGTASNQNSTRKLTECRSIVRALTNAA